MYSGNSLVLAQTDKQYSSSIIYCLINQLAPCSLSSHILNEFMGTDSPFPIALT